MGKDRLYFTFLHSIRDTPEKWIPTHPAAILVEEFLKPWTILQVMVIHPIGVPTQRIHEIVNGKQ